MNYVCPACKQAWGQAEGSEPSCPVCHTTVAADSGVENAGTGFCTRCNKPWDDHHFNLTKGSQEIGCPVVGRR